MIVRGRPHTRDIPRMVIASRSRHEQFPNEGIPVTCIDVPARILLPPGCIAEVFAVPEGTEIRIRSTKKIRKEKRPTPTQNDL